MVQKVFVKVKVEINTEGEIKPMMITWPDGREFEIEKITDIRRAASIPVGGNGMRYTCMIHGKTKFLFYEEPRWFMEGK